MQTIITPKERGITAVIGTPPQKAILQTITHLALMGTVHVIVGGNRFDVHTLAREVRRHTVLVDETLGRIWQVRPFTCIQTIKLLEETKPATAIVMLDMLTTFYDENISDRESYRLVNLAASHLRRLGQQSPVLITLRPPPTPNRAGLAKLIRGIAQQVYVIEPVEPIIQKPLF